MMSCNKIHGCAQLCVTILIPHLEFELSYIYYEHPGSILCIYVCYIPVLEKIQAGIQVTKEENENIDKVEITMKHITRQRAEPHSKLS